MRLPVPALNWLRTYDKSRLRGDLIAAITLMVVWDRTLCAAAATPAQSA